MTKPYTQVFKNKAIAHWNNINEKGFTIVKGTEIKNMRDLAKALGISKDSLYNWINKMIGEKYDNIDDDNGFDIDIDLSEFELPGEKKETIMMDNSILSEMMKDIGFWQSLARALGMKNYRQATVQLKLRIGTHLINGTGLVESNKKVKKELRLD